MTVRRLARPRVLAPVLAGVLVALLVLPPTRARGKAVGVLAEGMGVAFPRPLAPQVEQVDDTLDGVAGHRYDPGFAAPGIVFVPGATRHGLDDPRVARAATALARAGRQVFVPDLELYRWRFAQRDVDAIRTAARALARETGAPVPVLGFSYGGAFSLLAAAGEPPGGPIAHVAVFGAYYDLLGVIQAVTTGVSVVDGEAVPWHGDPQALDVLVLIVSQFAPSGEEEAVAQAVAGQRDPDRLSPAARALYELVTNDDPDRVAELSRGLDPELRRILQRFSPATVAHRIRVPVVALHSTDDPAVSHAESLRLAAEVPQTRLLVVRMFRHVDPVRDEGLRGWLGLAPDLVRSARFAGWVLAAGEPWTPATIRRRASG